jgi:hypothetical protein
MGRFLLLMLSAMLALSLAGCRVDTDEGRTTVDGPNVTVDH